MICTVISLASIDCLWVGMHSDAGQPHHVSTPRPRLQCVVSALGLQADTLGLQNMAAQGSTWPRQERVSASSTRSSCGRLEHQRSSCCEHCSSSPRTRSGMAPMNKHQRAEAGCLARLTIFVNPKQPKWVDAMNIEHGFLKVAVNRTHLQAEVPSSWSCAMTHHPGQSLPAASKAAADIWLGAASHRQRAEPVLDWRPRQVEPSEHPSTICNSMEPWQCRASSPVSRGLGLGKQLCGLQTPTPPSAAAAPLCGPLHPALMCCVSQAGLHRI